MAKKKAAKKKPRAKARKSAPPEKIIWTGDVSVPLRNLDHLGRCYDILKVDPLDFAGSSKNRNVFKLESTEPIDDQSAYRPRGTEFKSLSGGGGSEVSTVISTKYDYVATMKASLGIEASGLFDSFSFSLSASMQGKFGEAFSSNKMMTYSERIQRLFQLELIQDYPGERLQLDPLFRAKVAALEINSSQSQRDQYRRFINVFGTHFANDVVFGGRAYRTVQVSEATYTKVIEAGFSIEAGAKASLGALQGEVKGGLEASLAQNFNEAVKGSSTSFAVAGGTAIENFEDWVKTVTEAPAPIRVKLLPISSVFHQGYFPKNSQIGKKRRLMEAAVDAYRVGRGTDVEAQLIRYFDLVNVSHPGGGLMGVYDNNQLVEVFGKPRNINTTFKLINADNPRDKGLVQSGDNVRLQTPAGRHEYRILLGFDRVDDGPPKRQFISGYEKHSRNIFPGTPVAFKVGGEIESFNYLLYAHGSKKNQLPPLTNLQTPGVPPEGARWQIHRVTGDKPASG